MKLFDFLEILRSMDPEAPVSFYCPNTKTRYYIEDLLVTHKQKILLTTKSHYGISYKVKDVLNVYKFYWDTDFKFIHEQQEFQIQ